MKIFVVEYEIPPARGILRKEFARSMTLLEFTSQYKTRNPRHVIRSITTKSRKVK